MIPNSCQSEPDFIDLLQATAIFLWKDWPMDMEFSSIREDSGRFTIHGTCPHCVPPTRASFTTVTEPFAYKIDNHNYLVGVAQCIACRKFILATIRYGQRTFGGQTGWYYLHHYPIGTPDDSVAEEVPEHIRTEFSEAKRCLAIKAYSAAAEMCRRSVETSCLDLGAPYRDVLEDMIDWLEENRIITPALKKVAHQVRLGGNRGAHPWKVGEPVKPPIPVIVIEKEHAEAIVKFTWHFLEHVYVVPKQLPQYDFSKPKAADKK